jgi:hypothetical protein
MNDMIPSPLAALDLNCYTSPVSAYVLDRKLEVTGNDRALTVGGPTSPRRRKGGQSAHGTGRGEMMLHMQYALQHWV